ncbi:MAG: ADP-ribosylglycohydrolase family protein [Bacteroidales bacterium]|nr:ADP-ribosylglycohydrolase family protein [Bacteroidales bacterium]
MIGAIIGDIAGSGKEDSKGKLFSPDSRFTENTVMLCAVADAAAKPILEEEYKSGVQYEVLADHTIASLKEFGRAYPDIEYSPNFKAWLDSDTTKPYYSLGDGGAVRVCPVVPDALGLGDALYKAEAVTKVTHNHWEGIKGAKAVAEAIWMAQEGEPKEAIRETINRKYYDLSVDAEPDGTASSSVRLAMKAFLESKDFVDAIRRAGKNPSVASITGALAEAYYKDIPEKIVKEVNKYLDERMIR